MRAVAYALRGGALLRVRAMHGRCAWQAFRILKQRGVQDVQHLDGGWMSFALTLDR